MASHDAPLVEGAHAVSSTAPGHIHLDPVAVLVQKAKWYAIFAPDTSAPPVSLGQLSFFLAALLAIAALSPVAYTQSWVFTDVSNACLTLSTTDDCR